MVTPAAPVSFWYPLRRPALQGLTTTGLRADVMLRLRIADGTLSLPFRFVLDTGSDACAIPTEFARRLMMTVPRRVVRSTELGAGGAAAVAVRESGISAEFDRLPGVPFTWRCLFFDGRDPFTTPLRLGLGGGVFDHFLITFDPTPIPNVADDGRVIFTLRHPPAP